VFDCKLLINLHLVSSRTKLMAVLNSDGYSNIITWSPDGKSFIFTDSNSFERILLPKIFKVAKFDSFLRKVCQFGWHFFDVHVFPSFAVRRLPLTHRSHSFLILPDSFIVGDFPSVNCIVELDALLISMR